MRQSTLGSVVQSGSVVQLIYGGLLAIVLAMMPTDLQAEFPGGKSTWHGFQRNDFVVSERKCIVVEPESVAEGRPWIWRARFFGHEPQLDVELLKRGFHVAYCDVANLFGCPEAVGHWDSFYRFMIDKHQMSAKPALEGMSRGGLIVFNWAIANPDRVACIYADAPVCDFRSWPAGQGKSKGSAAAWKTCLKAYGMTESEATEYSQNPIDCLEPLASVGVPLMHVVGDADEVVPVEENTAIVEARYQVLGGSIEVIHKTDGGHHPHSLADPTRLVDFVIRHALN